MSMNLIKYISIFSALIQYFLLSTLNAQSFNDERTSAINFVKRVYTSSPFEGVKKIEGEESNYYTVALAYLNIPKDSILSRVSVAQIKAQSVAEQGFAEPCVKFEMIDYIVNGAFNLFVFVYNS